MDQESVQVNDPSDYANHEYNKIRALGDRMRFQEEDDEEMMSEREMLMARGELAW